MDLEKLVLTAADATASIELCDEEDVLNEVRWIENRVSTTM
jgi:hypothetical protein